PRPGRPPRAHDAEPLLPRQPARDALRPDALLRLRGIPLPLLQPRDAHRAREVLRLHHPPPDEFAHPGLDAPQQARGRPLRAPRRRLPVARRAPDPLRDEVTPEPADMLRAEDRLSLEVGERVHARRLEPADELHGGLLSPQPRLVLGDGRPTENA